MNRKEQYDRLIAESLPAATRTFLPEGKVYLNEKYRDFLWKALDKNGNAGKMIKEFVRNNGRTKICSVASSARLGFLYMEGREEPYELEKILHAGVCHPNYDAFCEKEDQFYEFKCHEFCTSHPFVFSGSYQDLFTERFGKRYEIIESEGKPAGIIMPEETDFHIRRTTYYFDLKQLLCHIFGLLQYCEESGRKPSLKYVIFVPNEPWPDDTDSGLRKWKEDLKTELREIFSGIGETIVNVSGGQKKLSEVLRFDWCCQPVGDVQDLDCEG